MDEVNVLEILGENFRKLRLIKNISIQELAIKINIDVESLERFESGEYSGLSIPQYIAIANGLDVSYEQLTNGIVFEKE